MSSSVEAKKRSGGMTSRERVIAAIEFRSPDHVPIMYATFPGALWRYGQSLIDLMVEYPDDFGDRNFFIPPEPEGKETFEEYNDEWGCLWRRIKGWSAGEVLRSPLEDWDRYAAYRLPPPGISKHFNEAFRPDPFAAGPLPSDRDWYALYGWFDLFERLQFLRGTANVMIDLAEDQPLLHKLADQIVERNIAMLDRYIAQGVDGVFFGDDWGTQNGLLVSPKCWRRFFKPRYQRMFKPLQDAGKHIFFHSCGYTVELWDELIELGVNVLNVQHSVVPLPVLKERLAGKVCICSDPSRQQVMPFGSPEDVKGHVREIVDVFASRGGGLIQRGEAAPDWPLANIRALLESFWAYGPL